MAKPFVFIMGASNEGCAALIHAINSAKNEVVIIKDAEKGVDEILMERQYVPSILKIEPLLIPHINKYVLIESDNKPFYHNITNKRKKRK